MRNATPHAKVLNLPPPLTNAQSLPDARRCRTDGGRAAEATRVPPLTVRVVAVTPPLGAYPQPQPPQGPFLPAPPHQAAPQYGGKLALSMFVCTFSIYRKLDWFGIEMSVESTKTHYEIIL